MSDKIVSLYRARLANERGVIKKDWGGRISIALTYPNHYRVGMSNLGFQVVYSLFNSRDDVVAERVFLPEDQETSLYLETGKGLLSLESQSMLQRFDIVAFSLSFENDYPNILKILQLGKIPLLSEDRDEFHPLIMAGGITTFLNPEPLASFFDLFLLGEAEEDIDEFIGLFKDLKDLRTDRQEALKVLARDIRSVYVPSFYHIEYHKDGTIRSRDPIDSAVPEKIEAPYRRSQDLPVNKSSILTPGTEFADRVLIELGRGCGRSCRFCAAGYVYRPPRVHSESDLLTCLYGAIDECSRLGLLSASILDTPGIEKIFSKTIETGASFSVSSLRADSLTREILEHLKNAGQRTLAIAPEAGSDRLRRVINKHLSLDQITRAVRMIAGIGDFSIKLYFLVGLPTESKDDVAEILGLVKKIKHHMVKESRARGRIGLIRLSVNCFIPKAFTPFQWFPMEDLSGLKEKQRWLRKVLAKEGGVKVNFDVPKWAYVQSLLSMGDRRVGSILLLSHGYNGDWSKSFRHSELNPDFFVYRPKELDEILPWDFIEHGIHKEHLIKEYRLALKEKESDICQVGDCDRCGVCSA
ncbi:MAG: radical SAM protein [Deltaproteobacteria bacterium]|nr:radical SAM protein [Deltaproteobacteria bacterium]